MPSDKNIFGIRAIAAIPINVHDQVVVVREYTKRHDIDKEYRCQPQEIVFNSVPAVSV
jgi:hypothetical protein